jgi:pimeloyl-ACP methyl ester carboxylesterase
MTGGVAARGVETLTVRDIEVTCNFDGDGPGVVFVHGLAQDHGCWAAQQRALQDYRTLAYDLRGHGRTTLGEADGTLSQLSDDLVALLEQVGPAACVGFSLGGTVVLHAGAMRPDLMPCAAVLGTSSVVGRAAVGFYQARIELMRSGDEVAIADAVREDTAAALASPAVDVAEIAATRLRAIGDGRGYCNAAAAMAALNLEPLTDQLRKMEMPVLVVGGEADTFCPRKAADIMLAALPDSTFREIPGVGHLMTEDDPGAVTSVLREFLDSHV